MCDGRNIASECEEGSTAEALISVCSSLFSGLTIQSLQSFDIGWDEWVNLPSDFTLQSRVKLKVVYISAKNRTTFGNKPKMKSLQATLQTSLYGDLSVDKNNVIPDKPLVEKYLFPNPHTERLKYYNKATEEIFEDHDDFPTPSEFKNYLLVERKWRYEMTKQLEKFNDSVEAAVIKESSGFAQRTAKFRKVPTNISSTDLQKCNCTLQDLEKINLNGEKLQIDIISRKKECYNEDMSLRPGGEAKLNFLDSSMETLSGAVAVVTKAFNDVNEVYKVINEHICLSSKGDCSERKSKRSRREKEQRRKNKQKKEKLLQRQTENVLKELVVDQASLPTHDITQLAQVPLITAANINMEAVKCLKRRFHLIGLKHLVKNNYFGADIIEHVNKRISDMEATTIKKQTGSSVPTRQISSYFIQSDDSSNISSLNSQSDNSLYGEHSDESISSTESESNITE